MYFKTEVKPNIPVQFTSRVAWAVQFNEGLYRFVEESSSSTNVNDKGKPRSDCANAHVELCQDTTQHMYLCSLSFYTTQPVYLRS